MAALRACGRTSRRGASTAKPSSRAARATRSTAARRAAAGLGAAAAHAEDRACWRPRPSRRARRSRLALEPAAVRLARCPRARREDVEDEAPARLEQRARPRAAPRGGRRRLHVQQRAERDRSRAGRALDRRLAQVAEAQVELDAGERRRARARPRASPPTSRRRSRGCPPRAIGIAIRPVPTPSSTTGPARAPRLLDVERDVLDDARATTGRRGGRSRRRRTRGMLPVVKTLRGFAFTGPGWPGRRRSA